MAFRILVTSQRCVQKGMRDQSMDYYHLRALPPVILTCYLRLGWRAQSIGMISIAVSSNSSSILLHARPDLELYP